MLFMLLFNLVSLSNVYMHTIIDFTATLLQCKWLVLFALMFK